MTIPHGVVEVAVDAAGTAAFGSRWTEGSFVSRQAMRRAVVAAFESAGYSVAPSAPDCDDCATHDSERRRRAEREYSILLPVLGRLGTVAYGQEWSLVGLDLPKGAGLGWSRWMGANDQIVTFPLGENRRPWIAGSVVE